MSANQHVESKTHCTTYWTATEAYGSARAIAERAKEHAKDAVRAAFFAGCRKLFDANVEIEFFGWSQRTECWKSELGFVNSSLTVDCWCPEVYVRDSDESVADPDVEEVVTAFLESFEDDDFFSMFGADVAVTIYRDGRVDTRELHLA